MFRRLPTSLPPDPAFPAKLEDLGYIINAHDQIRKADKPEQKFLFRINRNDRVNDVHREAMNICIRRNVHERLLNLGLEVMRLPLGASSDQNHVPILVSKDLKLKKRIIIVFGERSQDLGIFSFRTTGDEGIKIGSAIEMVDAMLNDPTAKAVDDIPGVILTNPGSLIWYRGEGCAVGDRQWLNLPRASAVHEAFRVDPVKNRIPGNGNYVEHIQYIFENVLNGQINSEAKLDIIGLEYTGSAVMQYLSDHWSPWSTRIDAICLGNPQHLVSEFHNQDFVDFFAKRARAYYVSDNQVESPLPGRERVGCNCYASGEKLYEEGILIRSWRSMLDWFNMVSTLEGYEEPKFTVVEDSGPDAARQD